jgi:hypothetical protein
MGDEVLVGVVHAEHDEGALGVVHCVSRGRRVLVRDEHLKALAGGDVEIRGNRRALVARLHVDGADLLVLRLDLRRGNRREACERGAEAEG